MRGTGDFAGHMSLFATTEPKLPCSGHGLRHTYRNACEWAVVSDNLSKKLMNHSQKGDTHSGTYGSRAGVWQQLLLAQECAFRGDPVGDSDLIRSGIPI